MGHSVVGMFSEVEDMLISNEISICDNIVSNT